MDWSVIKHFTADEFVCACCGEERMEHFFLADLDDVREKLGFPIIVNSGYRCPEYNDKISSTGRAGPHTTGLSADLGVSFHRAKPLLKLALEVFKGVGIKQHGAAASRFVHVDNVRERIWTYT